MDHLRWIRCMLLTSSCPALLELTANVFQWPAGLPRRRSAYLAGHAANCRLTVKATSCFWENFSSTST
jgi:hypothetical protein